MIEWIQPSKELTRVYTLGWKGKQSPLPQEVIPSRTHIPLSKHTKGPPLSPVHPLCPSPPAQSWMRGSMEWHLKGSWIGSAVSWRTEGLSFIGPVAWPQPVKQCLNEIYRKSVGLMQSLTYDTLQRNQSVDSIFGAFFSFTLVTFRADGRYVFLCAGNQLAYLLDTCITSCRQQWNKVSTFPVNFIIAA